MSPSRASGSSPSGCAAPCASAGPGAPATASTASTSIRRSRPADWEPDLRLLALDIETTPDAARLLACSLAAWAAAAGTVEEIHLAGEPAPGDPARCAATPPRPTCSPPSCSGSASWTRTCSPAGTWSTSTSRCCRSCAGPTACPFNLGRSSDESVVPGGRRLGRQQGRRVRPPGPRRHAPRAGDPAALRGQPPAHGGPRPPRPRQDLRGRRGRVHAGPDPGRLPRRPRGLRRVLPRGLAAGARHPDAPGPRAAQPAAGLLTGLPLERAWGSVAAFDFSTSPACGSAAWWRPPPASTA